MKRFPPFRIDASEQCSWRSRSGAPDKKTILTPRAYAVLRDLVDHAGNLVSHSELLDTLWPDARVQPEILKSYVSEIRRALEDDPKTPSFIETRTRQGYRFIAPVFNMQQDRSVTERPGSGQKIVGRADALTKLRMSADRMIAERPQIVCICGERGIGKTALAEEFLR